MRIATTVASGSTRFSATSLRSPASVVAEAGSQPMPSRPIISLASPISSSVTSSTMPWLKFNPRIAFFQDFGLPMRIAVATVSGRSTGTSSPLPLRQNCASGLAPAACTTTSFGTFSISPCAFISSSALPKAELLPRFPPGHTT